MTTRRSRCRALPLLLAACLWPALAVGPALALTAATPTPSPMKPEPSGKKSETKTAPKKSDGASKKSDASAKKSEAASKKSEAPTKKPPAKPEEPKKASAPKAEPKQSASAKAAAPTEPPVTPAEAAQAAAKASKPDSPSAKMSLADYLARELGSKFHRRAEWAGSGKEFAPILKETRVWEPLGEVRNITIHHAEGIQKNTPQEMIRQVYIGHTSSRGPLHGAADVGYHLLVDAKGEVWEGRDAKILGSHVVSHPPHLNNRGNIGICALGSYLHSPPGKPMADGILNLCELVSKYYGRRLTVRGHHDWTGINQRTKSDISNCPGKLEALVPQAQTRILAAVPAEGKAEAKVASSGAAGKPEIAKAASGAGR